MKDPIHDYYKEFSDDAREPGHFHRVISLHEEKSLEWERLKDEIPLLQRGWFELSRLSQKDRVEFTREYWLSQFTGILAAEPTSEEKLEHFFERLEDVGIFATQERAGFAFDLHMVYSLRGDQGFFHGFPPATEEGVAHFSKQFGNVTFPSDYLAFLKIHDGFSKYTDTGLIRARDMAKNYLRFQHQYAREVIFNPSGHVVDSKSLIPFYESFALHCYQCFYADWYPGSEMGNIYFAQKSEEPDGFFENHYLDENYAFPSFIGWLASYLDT